MRIQSICRRHPSVKKITSIFDLSMLIQAQLLISALAWESIRARTRQSYKLVSCKSRKMRRTVTKSFKQA